MVLEINNRLPIARVEGRQSISRRGTSGALVNALFLNLGGGYMRVSIL